MGGFRLARLAIVLAVAGLATIPASWAGACAAPRGPVGATADRRGG